MFEDPVSVRHSVLRLLALADRQSLDVRRTIELFSQEHWGLNRWRLSSLLREIQARDGAIANSGASSNLISDDAALAIRLGKATNTLSSVGTELTQWERPADTDSCKLWQSNKAYWTVVAFAMIIVAAFVVLNVGRLLTSLSREFEFEPSFFVLHMDSLVLAVAVCLLSVAAGWTALKLASWLFRPWLRSMPSWSRRKQVGRTINLWRLIAVNLEAGVPAKVSVEHLSRLHYDPRLRSQLATASLDISNGGDVWQSLASAKLLRSDELRAVTATSLPEVQVWTLRHLALRRREDMHFESLRRNMWVQPIVTLLFGMFVLAIGYAVFSTLTDMVHVLAERHG